MLESFKTMPLILFVSIDCLKNRT